MIHVPIKEMVEPPANTINHLSIPSSTMESESLVFSKKIGLARFKYVISIKNSKKQKPKIGRFKQLIKKDIPSQEISKSIYECLQMHVQMSLLCSLIEDKIFTIFSFSLHHKYMPITRIYTQNLASRLLILGTQKF
jgi:hypothetical protein